MHLQKTLCYHFRHDEVVYGKKSIVDKMPGDEWQKFANLRLLYSLCLHTQEQNYCFKVVNLDKQEWNFKEV